MAVAASTADSGTSASSGSDLGFRLCPLPPGVAVGQCLLSIVFFYCLYVCFFFCCILCHLLWADKGKVITPSQVCVLVAAAIHWTKYNGTQTNSCRSKLADDLINSRNTLQVNVRYLIQIIQVRHVWDMDHTQLPTTHTHFGAVRYRLSTYVTLRIHNVVVLDSSSFSVFQTWSSRWGASRLCSNSIYVSFLIWTVAALWTAFRSSSSKKNVIEALIVF